MHITSEKGKNISAIVLPTNNKDKDTNSKNVQNNENTLSQNIAKNESTCLHDYAIPRCWKIINQTKKNDL